MREELKKPSFIPKEFYNHACTIIRHLEGVVIREAKLSDDFTHVRSNRNALKYTQNLISEFAPQVFYKKFNSNIKLLKEVLFLFCFELPNWEMDFKTTGNEDFTYVKKSSEATLKLIQNINKSPDLMFNIQLEFWCKYLIKIINEASSDIVLEEGKRAKQITKELIFLNHLMIDKLQDNKGLA